MVQFVYMKGDEQAGLIAEAVVQQLITPNAPASLELQTFDLTFQSVADAPAVVAESAAALLACGAGFKTSTVTVGASSAARLGVPASVSKNTTLRRAMGGCMVMRAPLVIEGFAPLIAGLTAPITVCRHAVGCHTEAVELAAAGAGVVELVFTPAGGGAPVKLQLAELGGAGGVAYAQAQQSADVADFARSCFGVARDKAQPLVLTTKNTILQTYDQAFVDAFEAEAAAAENSAVEYSHRLIDDHVAAALKGSGGFVWACKNYDGDVVADMLSQVLLPLLLRLLLPLLLPLPLPLLLPLLLLPLPALTAPLLQAYGSRGMMTSAVVSADSKTQLWETTHGTCRRHFAASAGDLKASSTNPLATVMGWANGLAHAAKLAGDGGAELGAFAAKIEAAVAAAVAGGSKTAELGGSSSTAEVIAAVAAAM